MTCNCCGAERIFDLKTAKKELKKYRKSGPGKPTKLLLESLTSEKMEGETLLDIGGGIGAIQWSFLENGVSGTTGVDYSNGYLEVAGSYAKEKNWDNETSFVQGDFTEVSEQVGEHTYVTLDKVICCYPDYKTLLTQALEKCQYKIGLIYPKGGPLWKFMQFWSRLYFRVTGNPFRLYLHPPAEVQQLIKKNGFKNVETTFSFPWRIEVYQKNP
jgi:magnesium-protoporphyrin O-methyltransferase